MEERFKNLPKWVNATRFDTLRFRYFGATQIGKSLFDVSQLDVKNESSYKPGAGTKRFGAHRLLPWCPSPWFQKEHYIRVQHYLGSWESYTSRQNDPRIGGIKSRENWEKQSAKDSQRAGYTILPWIKLFVDVMGEEASRILLEDVGVMDQQTVAHNFSDWNGEEKKSLR